MEQRKKKFFTIFATSQLICSKRIKQLLVYSMGTEHNRRLEVRKTAMKEKENERYGN